jgi:hypothetical protein
MVNMDSEVKAGMKMLRQMSHFTMKNRVLAWDVKQVVENDGIPNSLERDSSLMHPRVGSIQQHSH